METEEAGRDRARVAYLAFILVAACLLVSVSALALLYQHHLRDVRQGLGIAVRSQAELLDAVAGVNPGPEEHPIQGEGLDARRRHAIASVLDAQRKFHSFGGSGTFTLAEIRDDKIVYTIPPGKNADSPITVAFHSQWSEAMRCALLGQSGVSTGLDYRGIKTIAAYEPIRSLRMGLVIKMDLSEARAPYLASLRLLLGLSLITALGGAYLIVNATRPLITRLRTQNSELEKEVERRVRIEEELEKSRRSYQDIVENINDIVYALNHEGTVVYVNPTVTQVLGYDPAEVVGRPFAEYVHPDDLAEVTRAVGDTLNNRIYPIEFRLSPKSGGHRWMRSSGRPVYEEGRVTGLRGVMVDVTERKQAEQALRESERITRSVTDTAKDGIIMMDGGGRVTYWNPGARQMFGYNSDEAIGQRVHELIAPADYHELIRAGLDQFHVSGEGPAIGKTVKLNARHKSGKLFPVELSLGSTRLQGAWHAVGIVRDITERKQAEQALRESETRLRTVIESINEGLVITDLDGIISYANGQMAAMCGCNPEELLGRPSDIMVAEHWRDTVRDKTKSRVERVYEKYELQLLRKDGTLVWAEVSAGPYTDANGNVTQTLAVIRDISERKNSELEKLRLESQLRQAQKMEAIGTLAGGIAHDFNNILTPIMAYTEMVIQSLPEDRVTREDLSHVIEAATRAKELVRQILTFSRQTEQERFSMSLSPIIKETLKLLRASLPATIEIVEDINPKTKEIVADPTQIHQILMNLCTNAAWAMRENGGKLEVALDDAVLEESATRTEAMVAPGHYVRLSVRDTGCGMDAVTVSRIFEPFFTTKGVGEGTGLGLPVVHGIVKSYGGEIEVESKLGQGTRFDIYFPQAEEVRHALPVSDDGAQLGTEHILLVDDESEIVAVCKRALERYGYHVTCRTSSVEALEVFRALPGRFDLIITDNTMPQLTGVQLAQITKKMNPNVPIILMTGFSNTISENNMKSFGIDALVLKPVVGGELAHVARSVLDGAKAGVSKIASGANGTSPLERCRRPIIGRDHVMPSES